MGAGEGSRPLILDLLLQVVYEIIIGGGVNLETVSNGLEVAGNESKPGLDKAGRASWTICHVYTILGHTHLFHLKHRIASLNGKVLLSFRYAAASGASYNAGLRGRRS